VSDWRYWITYEGRVQAEDEARAQIVAISQVAAAIAYQHPGPPWATIEVEEVGEGE